MHRDYQGGFDPTQVGFYDLIGLVYMKFEVSRFFTLYFVVIWV